MILRILKNELNLILKDEGKISFFDVFRSYLILLLLFILFYYCVDNLVKTYDHKFLIFFEFEKEIPFVKQAFIPYFIVCLFPLIIPFIVTNKSKFYLLILRIAVAVVIAGLIFLLIPTEIAYNTRNINKSSEYFIEMFTAKHNLLPSLHVCLTLIICKAIYREVGIIYKRIVIALLIVLPISTIFSHQHHILDLVSGYILSYIVMKILKDRQTCEN